MTRSARHVVVADGASRWHPLGAALACGVVLAACGTTTGQAGLHAAGGELGDPTIVATSTPQRGVVPLAPLRPAGTLPSADGAHTPATAGPSTVGGPRVAAAPTAWGPGVTATTVSVGIMYAAQSALNASAGSVGATGLVYGDLLVEQRAVVDWINGHGGVAGGRTLALVAHQATPGSPSPQAVCSDWTDDHKVFAGVYPGGQVESDVLAACMAQHRAIYINSPFDPGAQDFFDRFGPYYYAPTGFEATRMGAAYVDGLVAQGFFEGAHKLGLLYYERPSLQAALDKGVRPALARHGISLASSETMGITYSVDGSGDASTVSQIQAAELHMASAGVDRMMFLDTGAGLAYFFMTSAQNQRYTPRYGLESGSNPAFLGENFDAGQLARAIGVGWLPGGDVATAQIPDTPARRLCRAIMRAAGQQAQSEADLFVQYEICSNFFLLQKGLNAATAPNAEAFQRAVERLGAVPDASAASTGDVFAPGKHWGVGTYRDLEYAEGCACFRYYGAAHRA